MNRASVVQEFTFDDMAKISRTKLGHAVPIELYRAIRLIGMYQGLPMKGKGTTVTIGRKIGESLPVHSLEELFTMFRSLKIGDPHIVLEEERKMHVAVKDCFCEGLPEMEGRMVCDLEGAIMEGALTKLKNKRVLVKEIKCNVNGDDCCEYEIRF
ncbi:4-vinyl reductase [Paenibacillus thiaminolyticus]|uniref:V4R domain-containing protein n=1 Tax=Paenibacillus thiaminolyticus TaxID=49283 RepID=UPI0011659AC8|nr:4-vinyl reductase [Paenibacillus thiaminolyticus]NGP61137.1 4-vinyl reductase [Paenibacillus thiaminolyticus]